MQTVNNGTAHEHAPSKGPTWLVVMAAGSGGPQALAQVLPLIPSSFPGTIIVFQHMRPGFTRVLADQLNHICQLPVHEASDGEALQVGKIIIAPSTNTLSVERVDPAVRFPHVILLDSVSNVSDLYSSHTDLGMASAASMFGRHTVGVLLTGMGSEGSRGLREIAQAGGMTLVQDEDTSVVHDLPASAIDAGIPVEVLPLWRIGERVTEIVVGDKNAVAA